MFASTSLLKKAKKLIILASARTDRICDRDTGAAERHAEPDRAVVLTRSTTVLDAKLLLIDAAFLVGQRVAMEAGADLLLIVAFGSRSPASCSIDELIEW